MWKLQKTTAGVVRFLHNPTSSGSATSDEVLQGGECRSDGPPLSVGP